MKALVFQNYLAGLCHVISDALRRCQMIVSAKNSVQKDNKVSLTASPFWVCNVAVEVLS